MKLLPDEIHFDCPKCKRPMSGDKALLGERINCPDCLEPFYVTPRKPEPVPVPKQEFGLECPKCHKVFFTEFKQMSHTFVTCPNCVAPFMVQSQNAHAAIQKETSTRTRAESIRNQAGRFTVAAGLFCGIGLFVTLVSACKTINGDGAGSGFIVAASLIGASLWLYLIAQIVHIRANTEK